MRLTLILALFLYTTAVCAGEIRRLTPQDQMPEKEKIDVMIDDNYHICENIAKNGISVLYFHSMDRKHIRNKKNLTEIYNWGEAYRYITEKSKEK